MTTTKQEPVPLRFGDEAPPELVRALRALRRHHGDAARLARVAAQLGDVLDAAPRTTAFGASWRAFLAAKLGLAALFALITR